MDITKYIRYEEGSGVPKDHQRAFELYLKASSLGNATATSNIGMTWSKKNSNFNKEIVTTMVGAVCQSTKREHLNII